MDKFLLLVRRVFGAHVRYARERRWRGDEVLDVLRRECFDVGEEEGVALGLRLHVLDLWVDELEREKALGEGDEVRGEWVRKMGDIVDALRGSPVKAVRSRASESYNDERLPWSVKGDEDEGDEDGEDEDEGWGGIED